MNTILQIQQIKYQLNEIKLQIESIEMQNNNQIMMMNNIGDQLLNLSMKIFNAGIQTFKTGKDLCLNSSIFFNQLQNISDQINLLINSHNLEENQQMMMIQQQMMMMQQFPIIQQNPVIMPQNINQPIINKEKINVVFKFNMGKAFNIVSDTDITMEKLFDKYMERAFGYEKKDIVFICNAYKIQRNEKKIIKEYLDRYNFGVHFPIQVISIEDKLG